ncbi:Maternal protein tudor [Folsomia candida]|uniref:Maternal protein tudor n=1 Tax=Folsomia candida TaxID=158441 RepID=A0A226EP52_FOLCA|nr:Maternal protein tudor [Folsomia candida]
MESVTDALTLPSPASEVISYFREFRPLECKCCGQLVGFQHRVTGVVVCTGGCKVNKRASLKIASKPRSSIARITDNKDENELNDPLPAVKNANLDIKLDAKSYNVDVVDKKPTGVVEDARTKLTDNILNISKSSLKVSIDASKLWDPMMINPFKATKCVDLKEKTETIEIAEEVKNAKQLITESKHSEISPQTELIVQKQQEFTPSSGPAQKRFMWQSCKFSENLTDSAMVKIYYVWNANLIQIVAEKDEKNLNEYMDKIYSVKPVPLAEPPVVDQMVLGNYGDGQFYRGRVLKVVGELFHVFFVDYGDTRDIPYTDMYNVDEFLMKDPIYSARVMLDATPTLTFHIKPDKDLEKALFSPLQLQMVDKINLNAPDPYKVVLWMSESENLNDLAGAFIQEHDAK